MIEGDWPAFIDPSLFCSFDPDFLPLFEKAKLHFRHHAQHGKHDPPHSSSSINCRLKHTQGRAFLVKLMDKIENVAC